MLEAEFYAHAMHSPSVL